MRRQPSHRGVRPCRWRRPSPARPSRRPTQGVRLRIASVFGRTQPLFCVKRRQVAPAPASSAQMRQLQDTSTLPVSPVISTIPGDYAGTARSSLPLPVERRASSTTIAAPLLRQESSTPLPFPIRRQAEASPVSTPPSAVGGGQAGASPGGTEAATPPARGNESRTRLDESEMERVASAVMQLLQLRLQMEREARGL